MRGDSSTVVLHDDPEKTPPALGPDSHHARRSLSQPGALFGAFDSVVHGVSEDVDEGFEKGRGARALEPHIRPVDFEPNALSEGAGEGGARGYQGPKEVEEGSSFGLEIEALDAGKPREKAQERGRGLGSVEGGGENPRPPSPPEALSRRPARAKTTGGGAQPVEDREGIGPRQQPEAKAPARGRARPPRFRFGRVGSAALDPEEDPPTPLESRTKRGGQVSSVGVGPSPVGEELLAVVGDAGDREEPHRGGDPLERVEVAGEGGGLPLVELFGEAEGAREVGARFLEKEREIAAHIHGPPRFERPVRRRGKYRFAAAREAVRTAGPFDTGAEGP